MQRNRREQRKEGGGGGEEEDEERYIYRITTRCWVTLIISFVVLLLL